MGLCKCPVRKVTNQFCYEHRVNVCENCMVANHPKCVVLSYLKWLQDGDYNPICELCSKNLSEEDCVRLICYHVFHWRCLNHYAEQLPPTLAPAGYSCPSCKARIFPSSNLVSPVVDELRKQFETVNWGRIGLGLPLLSEELVKKCKSSSENSAFLLHEIDDRAEQKSIDTVVHIDDQFDNIGKYQKKYPDNVPRRLIHASENKRLLVENFDCDDNKYGHRNMNDKFGGRFSLFARRSKYFRFYFRNKYRRYSAICIFLFIVFFLLMLILRKIGNGDDEIDDPMFNPMLNPDIRINDHNTG